MKSQKAGKNTSVVEVQNISRNGIWVLVNDSEYFLTYRDFPWFSKATIGQIHNVEMLNGFHLHWPDLDVDLDLESLKNPEKYPLVYRA